MRSFYIPAVFACACLAAAMQAQTVESKPEQTSTPTTAASNLKLREELIGEMASGAKLELIRITDNHVAWIEKTGGKRVVKLDGKPVGTYDDANYLRFSRDEQHLAFTAKRNSKWVLILDGQERSKEYGRVGTPALSANGRFFAVGACNGKKCRLIVNGDEVSAEFEDLSDPGFTSNGDHYGYYAKRNKKWVFMLDGKEYGPEMADCASWVTDPDAKRIAVAGLIGGRWTWIVDGTPGPGLDVISDIAFTSDYKHYAYGGTDAHWGFAKHKTRGVMVVDGKIAGEYEGRGFGGGWQGMFGQSTQITTGLHSLSPDFHGVSDPQYMADGKLVHAGRRGDDNVVVMINGNPGPVFEDIVSPIGVSENGHIAYVGKLGESFVEVRDQKSGASFPGKRAESFVSFLMMSDEGGHLAYEIVRGGRAFKEGRTSRALRRVVIDGKAGTEHDAQGISDLALRAEGGRYHYTVIGAEGNRDRLVFNGLQTKLYDNVFRGTPEFLDDQTVEFVAQDGQRFVKVTAVLE